MNDLNVVGPLSAAEQTLAPTIPALKPIAGSVHLEAAVRLQNILMLDTRPWTSLTAEEREEFRKMEDALFEMQCIAFRNSIEAGDSESARKAYFGADYRCLAEKYEQEQEDERAYERRCLREAHYDDPPAWSDE